MADGGQAPKCIGYFSRYPEWPYRQCGCDDCVNRTIWNHAIGAYQDAEVVIRDTYPKPVGFELPEEDEKEEKDANPNQ